MRNEALYTLSPRWLDYSGLPAYLTERIGEGAWEVFRRLTELDVRHNLFPDWCGLDLAVLQESTGLREARLRELLQALADAGLILLQLGSERREGEFRVRTPLEVPRDAGEIRESLERNGLAVKGVRLRYLEDEEEMSAWERTLTLYYGVFGTRMNSRIAEDLRELAEDFDPGLLTEAFAAAKAEGKKSLAWVMARLYRGNNDEFLQESRRRQDRHS